MADSTDVTPCKHRIAITQTYRSNIPTQSFEDHYQIDIDLSLLDYIASQLNERHSLRAASGMFLLIAQTQLLKKF